MRYVVPIKDSVGKDRGHPDAVPAQGERRAQVARSQAANGHDVLRGGVVREHAELLRVYAITNTSALNTPPSKPTTALNPKNLKFHLALAACPRLPAAPRPCPSAGPSPPRSKPTRGTPTSPSSSCSASSGCPGPSAGPAKPTLSTLAVAQLTPTFRTFPGAAAAVGQSWVLPHPARPGL